MRQGRERSQEFLAYHGRPQSARAIREALAQDLQPVILAGGAGARLWPLSRGLHPKPFLRLFGDATLLQHTLARLAGLPAAPPAIVCNHDHRFLVAEQCREAGVAPGAVILEPAPRDTAPALALAALRAEGDPVLLALPADSYVGDAEPFRDALDKAAAAAAAGAIATLGVKPAAAETGFGYIRAGARRADGVFEVAAFTEKPARAVAEGYLAAGGCYWNSGIFAMRASVYLAELRAFRPDIHAACARAASTERRDLDFVRPGDAFRDSPADSIDYAVMERTKRAVVVPAAMAWSDLGSWSALAEVLEPDADGNAVSGDVIATGSRNCYVAAKDRLVAAVGLRDAVVVETADAVLVAAKSEAQRVKTVVDELRRRGRSEHRAHAVVYRPWGHAETFKTGDGFLVKRITVAPGEALSLQRHRHRAEHWVVARGEATVQRDDERFVLTADESTYIPLGARHRLANEGAEPLEVIEVQIGARLSEDDIERFDDRYGRA